jgi:hypothetical protein
MKYAASICLVTFFLTACVASNPYKSDDPVDQALKICGLGYSSQATTLYSGAYAFATKQGGVDFETKMNEYLKTQTIAMFESMPLKGKDELEIARQEIEASRDCVLNLIEKNRPKTRGDFVSACIYDLKNRVGDTGSGYPKVKNWSVLESHAKNSDDSIVVAAFVDVGGSASKWTTILCRVKDNRYEDLVPVESK